MCSLHHTTWSAANGLELWKVYWLAINHNIMRASGQAIIQPKFEAFAIKISDFECSYTWHFLQTNSLVDSKLQFKTGIGKLWLWATYSSPSDFLWIPNNLHETKTLYYVHFLIAWLNTNSLHTWRVVLPTEDGLFSRCKYISSTVDNGSKKQCPQYSSKVVNISDPNSNS